MDDKMKKQVQVVAILRIVLSSLGLVAAIVVLAVMNFAKGFVDNDEIARTVLTFIGTFIPAILGLISVAGIAAGVGLLSFKSWARILTIIISVLSCFNIPVGTLVGVYSIWVLMQTETVKLFENSSSAPGKVL